MTATMSNCVTLHVDGEIAVIAMDRPPVNSLGADLRSGVADALDAANANPAVRAVVLIGSARAFSGGADVTEFNTALALRDPNLRLLIGMLENSPKPVVAAIGGACLGGGLELALGAHFRVAAPAAQLGLPEVKLGLLPGAGGTQRLPRLLGLEAALNLIVSGNPVQAAGFKGTPLIDALIDGDLLVGATAFARQVVADNRPARRVRDIPLREPNAQAYLQFARNTVAAVSKNFPAPLQCVDAVAHAASKPFDEGLRLEREAFVALMNTPQSRALRHVFGAERAAAKIPGVAADTPLRAVRTVGVIGAGTMGGGISDEFSSTPAFRWCCSRASQEPRSTRAWRSIRRNYENSMKKGKLKPEQVEHAHGRCSRPRLSYDVVRPSRSGDRGRVREAWRSKRRCSATLDAVCKPGAILASNTSLPEHRPASPRFTQAPGGCGGLALLQPGQRDAFARSGAWCANGAGCAGRPAMALAKTIKKIAVVSGVCDGFIGNRMLARYGAAASRLIDAGAHTAAGGRLRCRSLAWPWAHSAWATWPGWTSAGPRENAKRQRPASPFTPGGRRSSLCEAGRYGQKTGCGLVPATSRAASATRSPTRSPTP